ncbi:hypothetical protein AAC387_Pa08g2112 [Persea americana]
MGRVRKIVKLDKEINRVNLEVVFLISHSTDLFLYFLAEKSMQVALDKKHKTIKSDHLWIAAKRHPPTHRRLSPRFPPNALLATCSPFVGPDEALILAWLGEAAPARCSMN